MRASTCYGFGDRQDNCPNAPGGKWSPYFCPDCDEARMAHLSAQFEKLGARASRRGVPSAQPESPKKSGGAVSREGET